MRKMTLEQMTLVMNLARGGCPIQRASRHTNPNFPLEWYDDANPSWNWADFFYRRKPTPRKAFALSKSLFTTKEQALDAASTGVGDKVVEVTLEEQAHENQHDALPVVPTVEKLVDAFLAWPLPESVCCDRCVIERGYPHRSGTNLLAATEARQMFEYVLNKAGKPETEGA